MFNRSKKIKKLIDPKFDHSFKEEIWYPKQVYEIYRNIKDASLETAIALYLQSEMKPIEYSILSVGKIALNSRDIFGKGYALHAKYVVLIYNHPKDQAQPTGEDRTRLLSFLAQAEVMDIQLLDIIIVGESHFWSMYGEAKEGAGYGIDTLSIVEMKNILHNG